MTLQLFGRGKHSVQGVLQFNSFCRMHQVRQPVKLRPSVLPFYHASPCDHPHSTSIAKAAPHAMPTDMSTLSRTMRHQPLLLLHCTLCRLQKHANPTVISTPQHSPYLVDNCMAAILALV